MKNNASKLDSHQVRTLPISTSISTKISKILVATDGSSNAIRAAHASVVLAANLQAELTILCVVPTPNLFVSTRVGHAPPPVSYPEYYRQAEERASKSVEDIVSLAKSQGVKKVSAEIVRSSGSVVEAIIRFAQTEKVDLIVTGTRGVGGFKKLLMGSVSSGVVAHAHTSDLVVR